MKRKEERLPFFGFSFVFTGTTVASREELTARVRELGGRVVLSVSGVTTFVVAGEDPGPSKLKKALHLNTKIISEQDFLDLSKDFIVQPSEVKRSKTESSKEKWIDKYQPTAFAEMVGNKQTLSQIKTSILSMTRKPLMITGPPGTGKTLAVYLAAKELGMPLIEYNGADHRNRAEINIIKSLSTQKTLGKDIQMHKNKMILLEEIENMGNSDRGGLNEILNLFKETKVPVILTVNDKSDPKIKSIIGQCKVLTLFKIDTRTITNFFKKIIEQEKIDIPENTLVQVATSCGGDLRYGINTLEYLSKKKTITKSDIAALSKHLTATNLFDITRDLFSPSISPAKKLGVYFEDPTLSLPMVFENYLEGTVASVADIADSLSLADTVESRIFYNSESSLFPVAGYFTAIRPKLRLSSRIQFTKCLGFSSKLKKNQRLQLRLASHLATAGVFGGWSLVYPLYVIGSALGSKTISPAKNSEYIASLQLDKEDTTTLLATTQSAARPSQFKYTKTWEF
ncbi:replication factor C subunit 1 [Nematocida displodere]|uniref:Replication factor C subunit 1 n=1 Tax=Nematocida displodere TaxID=1805483 RepID=A0A177ECG8_9MICR|nr:replication factor C subunit 1 [Nematocida displodere]